MPVKQWYLTTEDRASFLYIHKVGKGEPVIVVQGGPGAGHQYILDIAKGLENQFRFIFYDQRKAGLSQAAKNTTTMEKHIQGLEFWINIFIEWIYGAESSKLLIDKIPINEISKRYE